MKRLINEADLLTRELPGYAEYKKKVKYKSFPACGKENLCENREGGSNEKNQKINTSR